MDEMTALGPIKYVQVEAVVIRADGTQVPLGVISDSRWKRISPRRILAGLRIRNLNRLHGQKD